jgi:hypothetical protein
MNWSSLLSTFQNIFGINVKPSVQPVILINSAGETYEAGSGNGGGNGGNSGGTGAYFAVAFTNQTLLTIAHNSGVYPLITVLDNIGNQVFASITHQSTNQFTVNFSSATSGTLVYLTIVP